MARPSSINLTKKEQKSILSVRKTTANARTIAESLGLPRYHVMAFLEESGLNSYSEGSYL